MTAHRLSLAIALALASLAATAQTAPKSGDILRQVQPPTPPAQPAPALPQIGGIAAEPPMQALPGGGPAVQVDSIDIVGNRVIDTATLKSTLQGETGKSYTLPELEALAARLTRYYRSRGYFVARAYVPAQEIANGKVTLRVVEGNYGQFVLDNKSLVRDDIVQGLLDDIKDRDIVSLDTLERAMLIINDTPGVKVVRADVMPGQQVGTSDFAVGTEATPRTDGFVLLDNHGSRYTGRNRLSANLDWNSPTGRGDKLSLTGLGTEHGDLLNGRLGYSGLVASNGTRVEGALSHTKYSLTDVYSALGATGTADSVELNVTTPYRRTRAVSIEFGAGLAHRVLRDDIDATATSTRKKSTTATLQAQATLERALFGLDGVTQAQASMTAGHLSFDDAAAAALDAAGAKTQGDFAKANVSLSRLSVLTASTTLTTGLRGQLVLNDKNLDGSERLSIGGDGSVAAYTSGELAGDNAFVARAELAHQLSAIAGASPSVIAFASYGRARAAHPDAAGGGERSLGDVGVGFNVSGPGGFLLRLSAAHRVAGTPVSEPVPRTRVLAQAGWVF